MIQIIEAMSLPCFYYAWKYHNTYRKIVFLVFFQLVDYDTSYMFASAEKAFMSQLVTHWLKKVKLDRSRRNKERAPALSCKR
jgi:hypothetical protein